MPINQNSSNPTVSTLKKTSGTISQSYNTVLDGISITTWNGGLCKVIGFKKVYGGTKIKNLQIAGQIRMLTPAVPLGTKLTTTVKLFYVPNTRIWTNAEKFTAQKTATTPAPRTEPYISTAILTGSENLGQKNATESAWFRDSVAAQYYPRYMTGENKSPYSYYYNVSALPLRGYYAIYNDYLRNKDYDPEIIEYKTDTITPTEQKMYAPTAMDIQNKTYIELLKSRIKRGKKRNNYYTNTRITSANTPFDFTFNSSDMTLMQHAEWQKQISEMREQAENSQMNDWDIVAKIRGTKPIRDRRVRLLGEANIGHNYTQVAQTTYNDSQIVDENFQTLGVTGSYSYTEFKINLANYEELIEDGYIHIIAQTSADTIFSNGIDRELLNINYEDQYRPELSELKEDVLYKTELDTSEASTNPAGIVVGFKRKYSEIFKLPTHVSGDFLPRGYDALNGVDRIPSENFWIAQEHNNGKYEINKTESLTTYHWKDNTDLLINHTMALMQPTLEFRDVTSQDTHVIDGKNQFKLISQIQMIADLPINEAIKNDFKKEAEV